MLYTNGYNADFGYPYRLKLYQKPYKYTIRKAFVYCTITNTNTIYIAVRPHIGYNTTASGFVLCQRAQQIIPERVKRNNRRE